MHPLLCHSNPAFPLLFSYKEVISWVIISLPTQNIRVTEDQRCQEETQALPEAAVIPNSSISGSEEHYHAKHLQKNIIPVIAKQIAPSRLIKKVSGR